MTYNKESGYGKGYFTNLPLTTGKIFMLAPVTDAGYDMISQMWTPDADGDQRLFSTWALALAACVAGRGDVIIQSAGMTVAPTAIEVALIASKGVIVQAASQSNVDGAITVTRAASVTPQTTAVPYFTVTGKVKILDIIGEVTTVCPAGENNFKLIANPTVGADVDMCAVVDSASAAVGSIFTITGTLADAMVKTVSGTGVAQAAPLVVAAGSIDLSASASKTGATKWLVRYIPLDPGASVIAA